MKIFRNLFVLILVGLLFVSCFKDNDDEIACTEIYETIVTSVQGEHDVYIGAPLLLQLEMETENGCSHYKRFEIVEEAQDIYFTPFLEYNTCNECSSEVENLEFEFEFKKNEPGLYRLYFKSAAGEYLLHEVNVIVP